MKSMKAKVACTKIFEKTSFINPMSILKILVLLGWCAAVLGPNMGCSVVMASKQPDKKDVNLFAVGTLREALIAEFGKPEHTETKDGMKTDIFKFIQGYSGGAKAGRAFFHGVADVFTLGLWEVVGTPVEGANSGEPMAFKVTYDASDRVEEVVALQGSKPEESTPQEDCDSSTESCI